MKKTLISVILGIASGLATVYISIYALGHTSAFVMPHGFPIVLWYAVIVLGLGACAVALLVHFLALRFVSGHVLTALLAFVATDAAALAAIGALQASPQTLLAWTLGAGAASWWAARGRARRQSRVAPGP